MLSLIAYGSEEEAIRIANDSKYGLRADGQVASQLRTGRVAINGMTDDPRRARGRI